MAKTRPRPPKTVALSDEATELIPTIPHQVAETRRLFRLAPIGNDLSLRGRQIVLVAAETEDEARQLAAGADPFGRDWRNTRLFSAEAFQDDERRVVGDVIFKSTPTSKQ